MRWFLCLCCLLLVAMNAHCASERRVALLIGNAKYSSGPLSNPPNDVRQMEAALKKVGFSVQTLIDANQNQMRRALRDFGDQAQGADVALMYYSGHGTQAGGENYLIPIHASIGKESDYEIEAVGANGLMRQLNGARPKAAIVVLDACRDNPYSVATKSTSKGLGRMDAPTGSMIAFATAPNTTAGDEGYYARELARQLSTPGVELYDAFRNTTAEVQRLTKGKQVPRVSEVSITAKIYLAGQAGGGPATPMASSRAVPIGRPTQGDPEEDAWQATKGANTAAAYDAFLGEFPKGRYAGAARIGKVSLQAQAIPKPAFAQVQTQRPANASTPVGTSGLEWALSDNGSNINWSDATSYCASKGSGWSLPTSDELQGIYDPAQSTPCGHLTCNVAPNFRLTGPFFWTSEPGSASPGTFFGTGGSPRSFVVGLVQRGDRAATPVAYSIYYRALCVRRS